MSGMLSVTKATDICLLIRPTTGGTIVNHLMHADDIVLLSPSATGLSLLLHVCGKCGLEHDIRFNSKKSAVILFRNSFVMDFRYPSFVMNGESIKEVSFVKYIGNVISADMKDDLDIMRQCRQLYAQDNALARRFHMCSENVKATIFRTYCSSLYTSQLWLKYKVNSIRKLYVNTVMHFVCYSCYLVSVVQAACLLYIML